MVHWVAIPGPGRLGIMPRPRGGDWLEDEMEALRRHGVTVLVSLLAPDEAAELELTREAELASSRGLAFLSLSIADRDVPQDARVFAQLVRQVSAHVASGSSVAIHCRAGIGRSSVLAASVLAQGGRSVREAFSLLSACRGLEVPDTQQQRAWVEQFAAGPFASRGARDVDQVIDAVLRARPGVTCERLRVSHPGADDDGPWFFRLPGARIDAVQIESSRGTCPFLVEGKGTFVGDTVTAVVEQVLRELDAAQASQQRSS